jgi:xanthine dehydrogenase small subunit
LHIFASAQIKNSGTLVGNLVNASPIGDTIPFLKIAEAEVVLKSPRLERVLNVNAFFKGGYKELDLRADEIVTHVHIPKTSDSFKLYKVSTRKDLDISTVTFAARFRLEGGKFAKFSLALGGVGPTVLRMTTIEQMALGQTMSASLMKTLSTEIGKLVKPLSDVRGTANYRKLLCENLMLKFGDEVLREAGVAMLEASI